MKTPTEQAAADPTQSGIDAVKGMSKHWKQSNEGLLAALEAAQAELLSAHAVLDGGECSIVRNARDGYPEGREDRILTLEERVKALLRMKVDYARWLAQSEAGAAVMRRCLEEIAKPALGGKLQQYAAREALKAANLALGGEG